MMKYLVLAVTAFLYALPVYAAYHGVTVTVAPCPYSFALPDGCGVSNGLYYYDATTNTPTAAQYYSYAAQTGQVYGNQFGNVGCTHPNCHPPWNMAGVDFGVGPKYSLATLQAANKYISRWVDGTQGCYFRARGKSVVVNGRDYGQDASWPHDSNNNAMIGMLVCTSNTTMTLDQWIFQDDGFTTSGATNGDCVEILLDPSVAGSGSLTVSNSFFTAKLYCGFCTFTKSAQSFTPSDPNYCLKAAPNSGVNAFINPRVGKVAYNINLTNDLLDGNWDDPTISSNLFGPIIVSGNIQSSLSTRYSIIRHFNKNPYSMSFGLNIAPASQPVCTLQDTSIAPPAGLVGQSGWPWNGYSWDFQTNVLEGVGRYHGAGHGEIINWGVGAIRSSTVGYISGSGNNTFTTNPPVTNLAVGSRLVDSSAVKSVAIGSGGSGYTTATVTFPAPAGGVAATGTAVISAGAVTGINITKRGSGYAATGGAITITGDGTGATATISALQANMTKPWVEIIANQGNGVYTLWNPINMNPGSGANPIGFSVQYDIMCQAVQQFNTVLIPANQSPDMTTVFYGFNSDGGGTMQVFQTNYNSVITNRTSGAGGGGATANTKLSGGVLTAVTPVTVGAKYEPNTVVVVVADGSTIPVVKPNIVNGQITSYSITNGGVGNSFAYIYVQGAGSSNWSYATTYYMTGVNSSGTYVPANSVYDCPGRDGVNTRNCFEIRGSLTTPAPPSGPSTCTKTPLAAIGGPALNSSAGGGGGTPGMNKLVDCRPEPTNVSILNAVYDSGCDNYNSYECWTPRGDCCQFFLSSYYLPPNLNGYDQTKGAHNITNGGWLYGMQAVSFAFLGHVNYHVVQINNNYIDSTGANRATSTTPFGTTIALTDSGTACAQPVNPTGNVSYLTGETGFNGGSAVGYRGGSIRLAITSPGC